MNLQMIELMMSSASLFAIYFVHINFDNFNIFAQTCDSMSPHIKIFVLLTLFCIYSERIKASLTFSYLKYEIFVISVYKNAMENCEVMTSSTHSFAYSYRLVKKCFLKICETSKCHNFLIF